MSKSLISFVFVVATLFIIHHSVHAQKKILLEDESFVELKFDKLPLFAGRINFLSGDTIIIRHYGNSHFQSIYTWMFYSDPNRKEQLEANKKGGMTATIEYFFILKKRNSYYAKIKVADSKGDIKRYIININEALQYEELQIPRSPLISQYELYIDMLNKKQSLTESDIDDYLNLFEPVSLENKNEFEIERIKNYIKQKCNGLKTKSIIGKQYFEFHPVQFDKYDFDLKGIRFTAKKHFIYFLEPSDGMVSLTEKPMSRNSATVAFVNLKKKISNERIETLKSALTMGMIEIDRYNSIVSDQDTTIFIPIEPSFAETLFSAMDKREDGRKLYLIYDFKIQNSQYDKSINTYSSFISQERSLNVEATLKSISVYADPNYFMLLDTIFFAEKNPTDTVRMDIDTISEENKVYEGSLEVSNPVAFVGGFAAWQRYLGTNLNVNVPTDNKAPSGMYKVELSFVINKDGSISDIKILKDPGYKTADEAFRIIKNSPKWKPAIKDDKPVKFRQQQSISFYVSDDN